MASVEEEPKRRNIRALCVLEAAKLALEARVADVLQDEVAHDARQPLDNKELECVHGVCGASVVAIAEDARTIFKSHGIEVDWKVLEVGGGSEVQEDS